jgi:hypothetical protein
MAREQNYDRLLAELEEAMHNLHSDDDNSPEAQADRIEEYQRVTEHFSRDHIEWEELPDYMNEKIRYFEMDENGREPILTPVQLDCFWKLYELFQEYIEREGLNEFGRTDVEWMWTWQSWFKILLEMAKHMHSRVLNENDCWLSTYGLDEE